MQGAEPPYNNALLATLRYVFSPQVKETNPATCLQSTYMHCAEMCIFHAHIEKNSVWLVQGVDLPCYNQGKTLREKFFGKN